MEKPKHQIHWILPLVIGLLAISAFTSCGNDEPEMLTDYYLSINSQVRLNLGEEDENQGTMPSTATDVMSNTIVNMLHALDATYPVATIQGDDAGVITALDDIYRKYKNAYSAIERNTVCVVTLYRIKLDDQNIARKSTALKIYHFGAIPENTDPVGS